MLSFAVFVHKDSLNGKEFPEHEQTPWALIHRPKEEVCIWVWYDANEDTVEVIPFEDGDTELDHELIYQIIDKIDNGEYDLDMAAELDEITKEFDTLSEESKQKVFQQLKDIGETKVD